MFKRNPGRMTQQIKLLRPSAPKRDELGGLTTTTYDAAYTLFAMVVDKDQSRRQVLGDYVTADTKYFVMRDSALLDVGIDNSWRLEYNGYVYLINKLELINESRPYFTQITATAINSGGVINDV